MWGRAGGAAWGPPRVAAAPPASPCAPRAAGGAGRPGPAWPHARRWLKGLRLTRGGVLGCEPGFCVGSRSRGRVLGSESRLGSGAGVPCRGARSRGWLCECPPALGWLCRTRARLRYHGGAKALLRQLLLYGEPPEAGLWAVLYFSVCFKVNICD